MAGSNVNAVLGSSQSQLWGNVCGQPSTAKCRFLSTRQSPEWRASSTSPQSSNEDSRKDAVRVPSSRGLERRQLLVATTAAAAAGLAGGSGRLVLPGKAEPIAAPDFNKCVTAVYNEGPGGTGVQRQVECCPPLDPGILDRIQPIKDFVFPTGPVRTRKAAHLLTDAEKASYEKAYAAIKALPDSDPRSFIAQANVHCAYCNYGYFQQDGVTPLQVHENWLFLPFHRWYLYFHERILAKYANDPNLSIPFWNWDNQDINERPLPNEFPGLFVDPRFPTLSDARRHPDHFPPNIVDFTRGAVPQTEPQLLRDTNTALLYQNLVDGARTPSLFHGGAYRAGDATTPGGGTLEALPHGPPHGWTGGPTTSPATPAGEDMGNFYSAGRDPIFYSHHSNVDRMWTVWKTLPGGTRQDFTDPDWLNSSFLFYDENRDLVRVYVRDCLDEKKLGFRYAAAPDLWRFYQVPQATIDSVPDTRTVRRRGVDIGAGTVTDRGLPGGGLGGPLRRVIENTKAGSSFNLARPERPQRRGSRPRDRKARSSQPVPEGAGDDEDEEEILVLQGVAVPINKKVTFDIFINLPEGANNPSAGDIQYVGSFYNVPHGAPGGVTERVTNLRVGIGNKLQQLGLKSSAELTVTLVPREPEEGQANIQVTNFRIEYE